MQFIKPYPALEAWVQKQFDIPVKVHSVVQNVYTGAEMALVTADEKSWWIVYSSGDRSEFFQDKALAKDYFMGLASTKGELI